MGLKTWLTKKISKYLNSPTNLTYRGYLCDYDRICHEIIPGDVLLVEGLNRVSQIIRQTTQSPWTHCALYIGRLHSIEDPKMREVVRKFYHGSAGHQLLLEGMPGRGTIITPFFHYKNHHIRICRPTGLSHSDTQRVINFGIKHLGRKYDPRHIVDLWRFLITHRWFIPNRWRSKLFETEANAATKEICSSMIAEAFMSINFPILPLIRKDKKQQTEMIHRNPKLFAPSDFDYSPYFSIIKYPIFPFSDHGPYRNLPWNEDLISNDEEVVRKKSNIEDKKDPSKDKD